MSLTKYKEKRNFKSTPEPEGKIKKGTPSLSFVVQRHKASRLHYDFRLEMDGVLKSWAVPKGPSMNPADKRLAMMVEDHPYSYKDFAGVIPSGYGAGIVEIWDNGKYTDLDLSSREEAEKKLRAGLKAGNLKFVLQGKKLKGEFALVKIKSGEDNAWLLIKHNDEYAVKNAYDSEKETLKNSPINKWLAENKGSKAPESGSLKVQAVSRSKTRSSPSKTANDKEVIIGKRKVKLTNQNKIYWPDEGVTKGMMVEYYQQIADWILPYLKDRPESLRRSPNGIADKGFYHKDAGAGAPSWVKSIPLHAESTKKDVDYIICNDKATLAYLNNLGCIELNPWSSTIRSLDKPDYMIIDIDPSSKNTFEQVIETANVFKQVLDSAGATAFCKTSGATGMHIYVPMGKKYSYDQVRDFAQIICTLTNEQLPSFTSMERNLKKRGEKHIYLDYLQNSRGQTIACAYSLRPVAGATISMPLQWKEVKSGLHPSEFNIFTVVPKLKKMKNDPFAAVLGKGVDLNKCLKNLGV